MPMAMELRINVCMKVTTFATLTETRCVTELQSERLGLEAVLFGQYQADGVERCQVPT